LANKRDFLATGEFVFQLVGDVAHSPQKFSKTLKSEDKDKDLGIEDKDKDLQISS